MELAEGIWPLRTPLAKGDASYISRSVPPVLAENQSSNLALTAPLSANSTHFVTQRMPSAPCGKSRYTILSIVSCLPQSVESMTRHSTSR